jgi:hypothetical protein
MLRGATPDVYDGGHLFVVVVVCRVAKGHAQLDAAQTDAHALDFHQAQCPESPKKA